MQPLTLHGHLGPFSWKVAIVLETLHVPYSQTIHSTAALKEDSYTTNLNPNGFAPVLLDPNSTPETKLWESNAIVAYLLTTYDTSHLISYPPRSRENFEMQQYLSFQTTFQAPSLTHLFYYTNTSPSQDPAVRERFLNESLRVVSVLETALGPDKHFLVGDGTKCSAADLAFVMHFQSLKILLTEEEWKRLETNSPNVWAWLGRMHEMEAVKKVIRDRGLEFAKVAAAAQQKKG